MRKILLLLVALFTAIVCSGQSVLDGQKEDYEGRIMTSSLLDAPKGILVTVAIDDYEFETKTGDIAGFIISEPKYPFTVTFSHNDIHKSTFTVESAEDKLFIVDFKNSVYSANIKKSPPVKKVIYPSYASSPYGDDGYKGIVLLSYLDAPIEDVVVTIKGKTQLNTTTNQKGEFIIPVARYPFKVTLEHVSIKKTTFEIRKEDAKDNVFIINTKYTVEVTKTTRRRTRGLGGAARLISLERDAHVAGITGELRKVPGLNVNLFGDMTVGWGSFSRAPTFTHHRQSFRNNYSYHQRYGSQNMYNYTNSFDLMYTNPRYYPSSHRNDWYGTSSPLVVIDGVKWHGNANIHSLPFELDEIKTIEALSAGLASMHYGSNDGERGAIVITTHSGSENSVIESKIIQSN